MAMKVEELEDTFVISTEIGDQEVAATRFTFEEQVSAFRFEAMGGAEATGEMEFQAFAVPLQLQERWGLPPIWQNQVTSHFLTMGTDLWSKFPSIATIFCIPGNQVG